MKRHLFAALAGALCAMLIAAIPLWRQNQRMEKRVTAAESRIELKNSERPVFRLTAAGKAKDSSPEKAVDATNFTAEQCRAALDAAVQSGNHKGLLAPMCRWAELDGEAAFAWLDAHWQLKVHVTPEAISVWAVSNPAGCAEWMERTTRREYGNEFDPSRLPESPVWRTLLQRDLRAAIRVAGNLGIGRPAGTGLSSIDLEPAIRTTAEAEAAGAEILAHPEWLADIASEKPYPLLVALRQSWQEIDPDDWDRWAAAHPDAAAKSDNRPLQPSKRFARAVEKNAAATKILNSTPPEKLAAATADIVRLWNDLEAAGEWLNTLPHGPGRDTAAIAYALEAVKTEPEAAMRWAESIGDQGQRARTQRRVFAAWSDAQPAAASAWLPRSGWSEAQQQAARDIMAVSPAAGRGKAP